MGAESHIEWTDCTFNPWIGCTRVSPGCDHCYAEAMSRRRGWAKWGAKQPRRRTAESTWRQPLAWEREAERSGIRKRVFCASLADVFDAEAEEAWRKELWGLIRTTPNLIWLLLTKRPGNIRRMLPDDWGIDGYENVCLMVSVENQTLVSRAKQLAEIPAHCRALSVEPMLGPVDLTGVLSKLHWVIVGGESGPGARPMHPDWVRDVRRQCEDYNVAFFFKQWGSYAPAIPRDNSVRRTHQFPDGTRMLAESKASNGRTLDGRTYDDHPFALRTELCGVL